MNYTPEQISQIVLKNLKEDILNLSYEENVKLAQNPNTPQETLDVLATDEYWVVRRGVARNSNTSQESLRILATDEDSNVRYWVAQNPNISQETLSVLATDEDSYVRYQVARHSNATELVRRLVLMTDDEKK